MIKYKLVCVGKLKETFFRQAQEEYLKRLSAFAQVNVVETDEFNNTNSIAETIDKEGLLIEKQLKGYTVLLDVGGNHVSSEEFAMYLSALELDQSEITFIIGGSNGVSEKIKKLADAKISFSKMTFPHNLARIMLLEQLYRSKMIVNNRKYHK